jgi:hypothetical protein
MKNFFEELTSYRVKVEKDGREIVNVPGIFALPGALIAPKLSIVGTVAASLLGCSIHLETEEGKGVDVGKAVKDALMSKDPAEYLRGCDGLHNLMNVDGHTVIEIAKSAGLDTSKVHADLYKRYRERSDKGDDLLNQLAAKKLEHDMPDLVAEHARRELSKQAYGKNVYAKQGSTAVIVLTSVDDIDFKKWHAFLHGEGPRPTSAEPINDPELPTNGNVDSLAIFVDGIERAKADSEVKNVVIDVSNDDGGSDDIVLYMSSIIANRQYERVQNPLTNQTITERYDVDRNLDGKFDE